MKSNHCTIKEYKADLQFLRRFKKILRILFPSFWSLTFVLFGFLLCISLFEEYIGYFVGLISSKFYEALGEKNLDKFYRALISGICFIVAIVFIRSIREFTNTVLYICWKQLLCRTLHSLYFRDINFYKIGIGSIPVDNPDQRIVQDLDQFCSKLSQVFRSLIIAPFTIGYYSYQAYSRTGWYGPTGVLLFFLVSSALNKVLLEPLVHMVFLREKQEGDFRFKHMQIRVGAESVALIDSGKMECSKTNEKLEYLIETQQSIALRQLFVNSAVNFFNYLGGILSYLLLAIPIFSGKYDDLAAPQLSALVSETGYVCIYLISQFSLLVNQTLALSDLAGVTHRLGEMIETINDVSEIPTQSPSSFSDKTEVCSEDGLVSEMNPRLESNYKEASSFINVNGMSVKTPNRSKILVKELFLNIVEGKNIMVMGPSSSGKSSLLRVLRGLWESGEGSIHFHCHPGPRSVFCLPQKPFFTNGSLRQQIIYPLEYDNLKDRNSPPGDAEILEVLDRFKLSDLVTRVHDLDHNVEWDWNERLSPGEAQRLCWCRMLYHRPSLAFVDEPTSAVPSDMEDVMYTEALNAGITLLSIGHRESLSKYHDCLLTLDGTGGWKMQVLDHS